MTYVIGYLRVSTEEQARSGLGLEAQRAAIEEYCRARGWIIRGWYVDDGVSGGTDIEDREALPLALAAVGKGDVLMIAKRDRLARDPMIAYAAEYMLDRVGGRIVSVEDGEEADPMTAMVMKFAKDLVAAMERINTMNRTKAAAAAKKARGELWGVCPSFGWRLAEDGKKLVEDPRQQEIIREMCRRHDAGQSLQQIADWLNAGEVQTAKQARGCANSGGQKWHKTMVKRALEKAGHKMRQGSPPAWGRGLWAEQQEVKP